MAVDVGYLSAIGAGAISFLSPCVLPLVPPYLCYMAGVSVEDFRDNSDGYAVGGGGTILRTENGGLTWEKVNNSYPETLKRVDFADDKNGWIVGYGGSILRSGDKGRTWVRQSSNTSARIYGLFMSKKYGWAVGEKGLVLKYEK